jgi:hypothetical protein
VRDEASVQSFGLKTRRNSHLTDIYIDGRAVSRADFKGEKCGLESLAQNSDQ